jgi:hypothetical protein
VYVTTTVPADIPVTTPVVKPIVATVVVLLVHVPPVVISLNMIVEPMQTKAGPVTGDGISTHIVAVIAHEPIL